MNVDEFQEELYRKVKVLNETTWEYRANRPNIDEWLANFKDPKERLHGLYLLSQFMYFGSLQMRELLKCLYRDLYKYPVIESIRKDNTDTIDSGIIKLKFKEAETETRFLGIGNPSKSGTHLLYFFRQENQLRKDLFINAHEIFIRNAAGKIALRNPNIKRYVFIDDFCGSGSQAIQYSQSLIQALKTIDPQIHTSYLMLFSTKDGKQQVKTQTLFDSVDAVVELDQSFKCFDTTSRYFKNTSTHIDKAFLQTMCETHGRELMKSVHIQNGVTEPQLRFFSERDKLGFGNSKLLIGFHHNTPDNTLPIIWYDETIIKWFPAFRRYNKIYGL